jgi:hypothetical protein
MKNHVDILPIAIRGDNAGCFHGGLSLTAEGRKTCALEQRNVRHPKVHKHSEGDAPGNFTVAKSRQAPHQGIMTGTRNSRAGA